MTPRFPEGRAVVYCDGAFATTNGKTAHGLVRFTRRYDVVCVVDQRYAGRDAGEVLDGHEVGIPIVATFEDAVRQAGDDPLTHFVVGLAPDGGRLPESAREAVATAIRAGLGVDCGLHDYLSEDAEFSALAAEYGVVLRDIRKPPHRSELHFFSGKIEEVRSRRIALLGTDSAVGKRTTAWRIVEALHSRGHTVEMIGTGQTAWMQGVAYGIVMDSLVNDFVSGEIEHAIWRAWTEQKPEFMVLEGQGSLMNPAYPGGFELLAAGRPAAVVLQHAPARVDYDGFPGYPIEPLSEQIRAVELLFKVPVVAITVNHEDLEPAQVPEVCRKISAEYGLPCVDPLLAPLDPVVDALIALPAGTGER